MASFTLPNTPFPTGTSVSAYDAQGYSTFPASPPGNPIATATVMGGSLTFTGLTDGRSYFAAAKVGEAWKGITFHVGADGPPPGIPEDISYAGIEADDVLVVNEDGDGYEFLDAGKIVRRQGKFADRDQAWAGDFGLKFNGDEETAEFKTACEEVEAEGRQELHMPEGTIVLNEAVDTSIDLRGAGQGKTYLEHANKSGAILTPTGGGLTAVTTFKAPASIGQTKIKVNSTAGLAVGDIIYLREPGTELFETVEGGASKIVAAVGGEPIRIRAILSAEELESDGKLLWSYTEAADVRLLDPLVNPTFADFTIRNAIPGEGTAASRGILANYCNNLNVFRVGFDKLDGPAIYMQWVAGYRIEDALFEDLRESVTNAYGIVSGRATAHGHVQSPIARHGRHLFTTLSSATEIAPQLVTINSPMATELAFNCIDTHPGSRFITVYDPVIHHAAAGGTEQPGLGGAAIAFRGPDSGVYNPTVYGANQGFAFFDGADRGFIQGGNIYNCEYGGKVNDSNDVRIGGGLVIHEPTVNGILIVKQSTAWAGHMTKQVIDNVEITGDPSDYAIRQETANAGCRIGSKVRIPDATRKVIGITAPTQAAAATLTVPV